MGAVTASGLVVVVATDLVGSTATLQRLGETENDRLRRTHFGLLRGAITQHGGTEVKTLGDGVLAVFTSASGALAAALEIQRSAHRHNRKADPARLDIRVGVHAGEALHDEDDWFGEPVVVASRLCAVAAAGEVVVSDIVRMLSGGRTGIELAAKGDLELKGLDEPVAAWSATFQETDSLPTLPPGLSEVQGECVGRDVELDLLAQAWERAATGARQVVLVAGEPGVGKTRLAGELAARVQAQGGLVVYGRCDEETPVAYQPFVEALRRLVTESPPHVVAAVVDRHGAALVPLLPDLRPGTDDAVPAVADPDAERHQLFEAVAALLAGAAAEAPTLLVLDDLHWAAKPTLLLLRHLARSLDTAPLMVIGTYRDTDLDRSHPLGDMLAQLRRVPSVERIALRGLDHAGVKLFLAAAAGGRLDEHSDPLAAAIHAETEGNPFFVGEVLRHLVETGALVEREGRWESDRPLATLGIPEGVREVVGRRLSRLSERTNQALAVGALVGRTFDTAIVAHVLELDGDDLLDAVEEATASGVLVEVKDRGNRYSFSHALIQDTLAVELSSARRVRLHRRIAAAIEELHARNLSPWLATLARHHAEAARAGGAERAVHYAVEAANQAIAQLAFEDALATTRRALQVLELDDVVDPVLELEVRLVELEARHLLGPKPFSTFARVIDAARRVGTPEALARAAVHAGFYVPNPGADDGLLVDAPAEALAALPVEDSSLRARVLSALAYQLVFRGLPGGVETTHEAFDLAVRIRDLGAIVVLARTAVLQSWSNDVALQERMAEVLFDLADDLGPTALITGMTLRCFHSLLRGDRDTFERVHTELSELSVRHRYLQGQFASVQRSGLVALLDGRFDELPELVVESQRLMPDPPPGLALAQRTPLLFAATDQGHTDGLLDVLAVAARDNPGVTIVEAGTSFIRAELGDLEGARSMLHTIIGRGLHTRGAAAQWPGALALMATAAALADDAPAATALERHLLPLDGLMVTVGVAICLGPADRFLALTAMTQGRYDEAEARLEAARSVEVTRLRSPVLAARTRYWQAALALRRGDRDRGLALAAEARAEAAAAGAGGIIRLANALLAG